MHVAISFDGILIAWQSVRQENANDILLIMRDGNVECVPAFIIRLTRVGTQINQFLDY